MKFFDREAETQVLRNSLEKAKESARFVVVTGRRRIGKTQLVLHSYGEANILCFFVARKAEAELCRGYLREIEEKLDVPVLGSAGSFAEIFEYVMRLARQKPLTLFIDEFQDFMKVNPSIFSDMQRIWDLNHQEAKLNLRPRSPILVNAGVAYL